MSGANYSSYDGKSVSWLFENSRVFLLIQRWIYPRIKPRSIQCIVRKSTTRSYMDTEHSNNNNKNRKKDYKFIVGKFVVPCMRWWWNGKTSSYYGYGVGVGEEALALIVHTEVVEQRQRGLLVLLVFWREKINNFLLIWSQLQTAVPNPTL